MTAPTPPPASPAPAPHQDLDRARRAFDGAHQRIIAASTEADLVAEFGILLDQLYRLGEVYRKWRGLSKDRLYRFLHDSGSDDLRAAGAAIWARKFDVHKVVKVASSDAANPDIYSDAYGGLAWKPLAEGDPGVERDKDYADVLEGRHVASTIRRAFDAMAALL
jgi:hypothetical protein